MSYKVLARKWRPQHFRDMLGQEPVLRALVNALDSNRLHHAYLFTGMRGVGKTTIARIFAKCLNCETRGVTSDPCGTCSACQDIDAGRFLDLIEVDAASRTKVEGTRELLENVPYAPASGRYKVYLIDEVHMFSTHSFNALLKTLEEPPEHVKFLLATTDPQKVPATVLSRCLQFNLKRMAPGILTDYLSKILNDEAIKHERPALDLIARASEGSVRDALSLVEQAAASGQGAVRATEVESMLGRASVERLLALIETLAAGDMPAVFSQVEELAQYAPEFSELLGEILTLLHRIAMLRSVPGSVTDSAPGYDRLSALASTLDPDVVQLFYQIGLHARRDMPYAPDTREAFDMALLRMQAFKPLQGAGDLSGPRGVPGLSESPVNQAGNTGQISPGAATGANADAPVEASVPVDVNTKAKAKTGVAVQQASPSDDAARLSSQGSGAPDEAPVTSSSAGLAVRGSVCAGGLSMRDAALAAARGETLPDNVVQQLEQLKPHLNSSMSSATESKTEAARQNESARKSTKKTNSDLQCTVRSELETPVPSAAQSIVEPTRQTQSETCASAEAVEVSTEQTHPDAPPALDPSALTTEDWPKLVSELDIAGMPLQLANNCTWVGLNKNQVALQIEASSEHLQKDRFVERLQNALSQWFGRDMRVAFEQVMQPLNTPAKLAEAQAARDLAAAHDSIKLDPIVLQLIDKVDGAVDEASIRPIGQSLGES